MKCERGFSGSGNRNLRGKECITDVKCESCREYEKKIVVVFL